MTHFITASGLVKIFRVAELEVVALQGLELEADQGEILALVGPSGSGKSTLLNALGGLDRPSAGKLEVDGRNLLKMNPFELTAYRREMIGFVWQQTARNLLPYLTGRENIELLMTLSGNQRGKARRAWIDELLDAVGMREFANQRPTQLSGGQQQRIAIACALANRPRILLGDEPTGEVDWPTAQMILALLRALRERFGLTIVLVTHDPRVAAWADRTVAIRDGQTSTETVRMAMSDGQQAQEGVEQHAAAQPTSEELIVLDSAGRLQIPGDQRVLAKIGRRARVEVVDGGILIRPSDDERDALPIGETAAPLAGADSLYSEQPLYNETQIKPRRGLRWPSRPKKQP